MMLPHLFIALSVLPPGTASGPVHAPEVTAAYSSQGVEALRTMTGKRIRGVGLSAVTVCAAAQTKIPVGWIYQTAVEHGISPLDPDIAVAMINRKVGFSLYNVLPDIVANGSVGIALLGAARVISMSTPWLVGLTAASGTLNLALNQLRGHAPDPAPLTKALLDPAATMTFADRGCAKGMLVVRYKGKQSDHADGVYPIR